MKRFNYHTHSVYCDGKNTPREIVEAAIAKNFKSIGFSSHSPTFDGNGFSILHDNVEKYTAEIKALKQEYTGKIEILLSLEFDYIPGFSEPMHDVAKRYGFDYILGSVHLVPSGRVESASDLWFTDGSDIAIYDKGINKFFDGDVKRAVKAFYYQTNEMLEHDNPTIIGHFDKVKMNNQNRLFSEEEEWYKKLVMETIDLLKEKETIVEVNTRGMYRKRCNDFFPAMHWLKRLKELNIPVTISSDAHFADDLDNLWDDAETTLQSIGFRRAGKKDGIEILL